MMLKLSELLNPKYIKLDLNAKRKKEVIGEMVELLCQSGKIKNAPKIEKEIIQREKEGTTGIGGGIAIPHIRSKEISQTVMALGRKKEGLEFDAIDEKPVNLIFLLLGPKGEESQHLKILCKLSRILHNTQFKEILMRVTKEEEVVTIFREQEEKEG
ncbi:PTS sugar transporter subunit IIA [Candidatus Aerophobetes bacterium]|nr:PTS sugar transporter subunit IIA [Candidatus Aerophobetes bacterium]